MRPLISTFLKDLGYAARIFRRDPAFTAVIVVSIALGVAANTTVFSIVNGLLLGDLPVSNPDTFLVFNDANSFSYPDFIDFRDQTTGVFSGVSAYFPLVPASFGGHGEPERIWGQLATANFLDVAGIKPVLGRGFLPEEDKVPGRNPVVLLGNGFWKRRFGADPAIIGRDAVINGRSYTVIGVMPQGFHGAFRGIVGEFWVPLSMVAEIFPDLGRDNLNTKRNSQWLQINARLKPGVTREQALAALNVVRSNIDATYNKDLKEKRFMRLSKAGGLPGEAQGFALGLTVVLMGVVGLVLLVACANVANLLLARATARQKEIGIRLSIGALRGRIVRQLLTESFFLAIVGAVAGFLLSLFATRAVSTLELPIQIPIAFNFAPDLRVFAYTAGLAILTGIVFGLAPALRATRTDLVSALKDSGGSIGRLRTFGLRNGLVIVQVALSLVLLLSAGLFLRSLQNASSIDTGMHAENVLLMAVDPKIHSYSPERTAQFFEQLEQRLQATPGVQSTTLVDVVPLSIGGHTDGYHNKSATGDHQVNADIYDVGARYFETMGIALLRGRDFTRDLTHSRPVTILNENAAAKLFPNEDPLGRLIEGEKNRKYEVIAVVRNTKSRTLGEDPAAVVYHYLPQDFNQAMSFFGVSVAVRTTGHPGRMIPTVRNQIAQLDRNLAVFNVETMAEHMGKALLIPRLCATILGICGAVGLVLATVGLYGVLSFTVRRRTREIGIRMALGAPARDVLRTFTVQGLVLAGVGLAIGLGISFAATRLASSLLYGISATDPITFFAVPAVLLVVAFVAVLLPARRAARTDPMSALRYE